MTMMLRYRKGGGIELLHGTEFPDEWGVTAARMSELALAGYAKIVNSDLGEYVVLELDNARAEYDIVARPGQDREQPSAWVLRKRSSSPAYEEGEAS